MIEKFLTSSDRELIVLKYDGHNWYNRNQLAGAYGYKYPSNMFRTMKPEDVHVITLCKDKLVTRYQNPVLGLNDVIKMVEDLGVESYSLSIFSPTTSFSCWVREDTVVKYSQRANLDKLGGDGQKILDILLANQSQRKTLVEIFEEPKNPLLDLLNTEAERLGLSKEYISWYWGMIKGIYWFEKINYGSNIPNGVKCLMGTYSTLESRFMKVQGKNSAKKVLKKQGASSKMISSNRKIARVFNPPSSDQMTYLTKEFMRTVDLAVEEAVKEGSMSRNHAIITALSRPKEIFDKYILEDEDNIVMLQSISILHKKGYADDNEKEFKEKYLTDKDKQLLESGTLSIDMKKDYTQKLFKKIITQKQLGG